ncbi:MAG TPA: alpha/beta fold hydrolase [Acidimicrobiales bacterium]|jgi:2-succinyl-6-hydroxy-2,4-cyclohexadiene-1-carboxylate synthase|nr:alpha/beta fold hydrolase [Acidimicrobiales bacterium]
MPQLNVVRSGSGPRVALVHGFTQSAGSWAPLVAALEDRELVMPDLPGHGGSPLAEGGLAGAARLLGEACGPATYVGYSLGGRTCLHLAFLRPELVERLVLVSTSAGIDDLSARDERRASDEALAARLEAGGDDALPDFVEEWLSGPLFSHLDPAQADRASRLVNSAAGLASSLRQCGAGTQLPLWEELRTLTMPVLVVAGEHDPKYVDLGARLASAVSDAQFVVAAGAGHSVPFEVPDAFAALVRAFTTRSRSQTGSRTPATTFPSSPAQE